MSAQTSMLPPLISTDELEQLRLRVLSYHDHMRRAGTAPQTGFRRSPFRGQGMELYDIRPYRPGDDIRHLDWRAIARSGRATTKVFIEERSRKLLLLLDRRTPMFFGTRHQLKASSAVRAAAILGFSAQAMREPVAAAILETRLAYYPPSRSHDRMLPLLQAMAAAPAAQTSPKTATLASVFRQIMPLFERGTALCLISDFHDLSKTDAAALRMLADHFAVNALHVIDPAEEQLSDAGMLRLAVPEQAHTLLVDSSNPTLRRRYAEAMAHKDAALSRIFAHAGIQRHKLYTHRDTFGQLDGLL